MAMRGWAGGLGGLQDAASDAANKPVAAQVRDILNTGAKTFTQVYGAIKNPGAIAPPSTNVSDGSGSSRGNNVWYALGAVALIGGVIYYWKTKKRK